MLEVMAKIPVMRLYSIFAIAHMESIIDIITSRAIMSIDNSEVSHNDPNRISFVKGLIL